MADILDLLNAINAQVNKLTQKSKPQFIQKSEWVKYNRGRFSIDDYLNATESRKEAIERDIRRNYERMPTELQLREQRQEFINAFNEAAEKAGVTRYNKEGEEVDLVTSHNAKFFQDFVDSYEERLKNYKFKDSGQIVKMYYEYTQNRRKYKTLTDFFNEYEKSIPK